LSNYLANDWHQLNGNFNYRSSFALEGDFILSSRFFIGLLLIVG